MSDADDANVLLVVLDSVRAANVPLYGYQRDTTPRLNEFADTATTYLQARAPSNWSLPSLASVLTGREAHQHELTVDDEIRKGATIFESLAAEGYDTGVFAGNQYLTDHPVGIADAFDDVAGTPDDYPDKYDTRDFRDGPDGFWYADRFLEWVDDRYGEWAACISVDDAHRFYEPRDEHDQWGDSDARSIQQELDHPLWEFDFYGGDEPLWKLAALENLYDGGIRQADAAVGRVLDGLRERDAFDDTLVVVCSDTGAGFGELAHAPDVPPAVGHVASMHEVDLHVPLLVKPPGQHHGRTVPSPASLSSFPEAVQTLRAGGQDEGAFVPDHPVVASAAPPAHEHLDRAVGAVPDLTTLFDDSKAAYVPVPLSTPTVTKYCKWNGTARELTVHGARAVTQSAVTEPAFIDSVFDEFDPSPIGSRRPDADESVAERLEERNCSRG